MRVYKFRGATQVERVLDVIQHRRLYCARWAELNDPMESLIVYSYRATQHSHEHRVSSLMHDVPRIQKQLRICSLSKTYDSHLMWAHYADSFAGVAIEMNIPEADCEPVEYAGYFHAVNYAPGEHDDARLVARKGLLSKHRDWRYEKEVRIIREEEFYYLSDSPLRVIAGFRMPAMVKTLLWMVCSNLGIGFGVTGFGDEGIDVDYWEPERRDRLEMNAYFRHLESPGNSAFDNWLLAEKQDQCG